MAFPAKFDPDDEIGDADPVTIGAIVARYCSGVSPSEIIRFVREALARRSLDKAD